MEVLRLIDESRLPVADGMQVPTVATVLNMTHYCLLFGVAISEGKVMGPSIDGQAADDRSVAGIQDRSANEWRHHHQGGLLMSVARLVVSKCGRC